MKITKYIAVAFAATTLFASCSKTFLDTEYTRELDSEAAGEAAGKNPDVFLNGMWAWSVSYDQTGRSAHDDFGFMSVLHSTDMMGQDIGMASLTWFQYDYQLDNRMFNYRRTLADWTNFYTNIAKANEIISLYPNGGETTSQKGLLGQAYAMRGMSYYYLIQIYQHPVTESGAINRDAPGVPLMYVSADGKSDDEIAAAKGRNTVGVVYAQIESDLLKAVENLEDGYVRPTKNYIDASVANGLLARYYLLSQQWANAAAAAVKAQTGYTIMGESGLNDGFMTLTNAEWMWGFAHTSETQTTYASFFSHISNLAPGYAGIGYAPRVIDRKLYEAIPETDYRKTLFNGPDGDASKPTSAARLPFANVKFGNNGAWTMNYMYMRAAEMILIEAEALAQQNQNTQAATALKKLMTNRQPDWNESSVTVEDVYLQRRIELWGEGFSFFDLKRLNKGIDRSYTGTNHPAGYQLVVPARDKRWVLQIPLREIQENTLINEDDNNPA